MPNLFEKREFEVRNFFRPLSYYRYTFGVSFFMIFKLKSLFQKLTKNDDNNFRRKFVPFLIDPRHKKKYNLNSTCFWNQLNSIVIWISEQDSDQRFKPQYNPFKFRKMLNSSCIFLCYWCDWLNTLQTFFWSYCGHFLKERF